MLFLAKKNKKKKKKSKKEPKINNKNNKLRRLKLMEESATNSLVCLSSSDETEKASKTMGNSSYGQRFFIKQVAKIKIFNLFHFRNFRNFRNQSK